MITTTSIRVGDSGRFILIPPFNSKILENVKYTCHAIKSLTNYLQEGEDAFKLIYEPLGLSEAIYLNDLENNVVIIIISGEANELIEIPSSYIDSPPVNDGVEYQSRMLGFALGPLPVNYDITDLISKIENAIFESIGVISEAKMINTSEITFVSDIDHEILLNQREALVTNNPPIEVKYNTLLAQYNDLNLTINGLNNYIKNHYV